MTRFAIAGFMNTTVIRPLTALIASMTAVLAPLGSGPARAAYDAAPGAPNLISANPSGVPGNGISEFPAWSPDGSRIAFLSWSTNLTQDAAGKPQAGLARLLIRDLATGRITTVRTIKYRKELWTGIPVWSPDNRHLAFAHTSRGRAVNLYVIDTSTGQAQKIIPQSWDDRAKDIAPPIFGTPAWSPDGAYLAFDSWASVGTMRNFRHGRNVFVVRVPHTGDLSLVSTLDNRRPLATAFSPRWVDNTHLIFVGSRTMSSGDAIYKSGIGPSDRAKKVLTLSRIPLVFDDFVLSPDREQLLIPFEGGPLLMNLAERSLLQLGSLRHTWQYSWSPDGSSIGYLGSRGDRSQVGVYSLASRMRREVARTRSTSSPPVWSADSQSVAWTHWARPRQPPQIAVAAAR